MLNIVYISNSRQLVVSLVSGLQIHWNPRRLDIQSKRSTFMQSLILTTSLGLSSYCKWDTVRFSIALDRFKGLGKTVGEEKRFSGSLDNFPLHELAPFSFGKFGYQLLISSFNLGTRFGDDWPTSFVIWPARKSVYVEWRKLKMKWAAFQEQARK